MSTKSIVALFLLILAAGVNAEIWTHHSSQPSDQPTTYDASGTLPDGAPPRSDLFSGVAFSNRYANYTKADTWYPSWGADGNLYSPWTDGSIDQTQCWSGYGEKARHGYAVIVGDDPLNLSITNYGTCPGSASPYRGRYPCGSLVYNGVWYYATYGLQAQSSKVNKNFGWYVLGPLPGFSWSTDFGKTWHPSPHTTADPLFPEPNLNELDHTSGTQGPFIKMGAPHFVDFGRNMRHSPDGKAYLVGHGSPYPDPHPRIANNSWNTADAVYMARVTPSIKNINDRSQYEFFAGRAPDGQPIWSSSFQNIKPVFQWNNHCGIVTATFNPALKRYFMCITDGHRVTTSRKKYTSYILESQHLTGPWKLVAHMVDFGPQAYFLNFPSKFISSNGMTMWLCYSANYMNAQRNNAAVIAQSTPPGSAYALSLHEMTLIKKNNSAHLHPQP